AGSSSCWITWFNGANVIFAGSWSSCIQKWSTFSTGSAVKVAAIAIVMSAIAASLPMKLIEELNVGLGVGMHTASSSSQETGLQDREQPFLIQLPERRKQSRRSFNETDARGVAIDRMGLGPG